MGALELDPQYVKAWARKGDIEFFMKEYHKSMESYKKGLGIDSTNQACKEGLMKVNAQISPKNKNANRPNTPWPILKYKLYYKIPLCNKYYAILKKIRMRHNRHWAIQLCAVRLRN